MVQENVRRDEPAAFGPDAEAMWRLLQCVDGWRVVNVDVIVFAEQPKLGPVKAAIRQRLAELLRIDTGAVNVKAKTGERVGVIGRGEAISSQVVVLIDQ